MDTVRAAMGDDQLSYLGFSYGTAIGQVYADLFPEQVEPMVLDGVLELGPTGLELAAEQAAGFETALGALRRSSATPPRLRDGRHALDRRGRGARPGRAAGGIPAPDADRPAGPGEADLGIGLALYSQSLWNDLDRRPRRRTRRRRQPLVALADQYIGIGDFDIYFAVNCIDFDWPVVDPDAFLEPAKATAVASPHFGEALVNDYVRCVDWPVPPDPLPADQRAGHAPDPRGVHHGRPGHSV